MCLGIPGRIVEISDENANLAVIDVGGVRQAININFVSAEGRPPVGTWVVVHVGFAMSHIDE
jgi:hydrogenase expression/formation protein HypC